MSSLEINCKKGNSNFTVYGIYRPPQIDINSFLDEFEQLFYIEPKPIKVVTLLHNNKM